MHTATRRPSLDMELTDPELTDPAGTGTLRFVPNEQADVSIPLQLTNDAKRSPRNTLLEPPHEYAKVGSNLSGAVVAEPGVVHFAGIKGGGDMLTVTIRLLNVSGEALRMHIHPPTTLHNCFHNIWFFYRPGYDH